jgi:ABC-type lipoprotein release transport system permease subunit
MLKKVKKVSGVIIIVIGSIIFLFMSYGFIRNLTTKNLQVKTSQVVMSSRAPVDKPTMYNDSAEFLALGMRKKSMIVQAVLLIIGAGITFGGLALYKSGKRETPLVEI